MENAGLSSGVYIGAWIAGADGMGGARSPEMTVLAGLPVMYLSYSFWASGVNTLPSPGL